MIIFKLDTLPRRAGKHCSIYHLAGLSIQENERFEYHEILKIFLKPTDSFKNIGSYRWGDPPTEGTKNPNMSVKLVDATKIQNFMWLEGLAPRVYELVGVEANEEKYFAQWQDFVEGDHAKDRDEFHPIYDKVKKLGKTYGFTNEKDDCSRYDVIQGKLVDFNTFHLTEDHTDRIRDLYRELGVYGKAVYHPEFGLTAPRDNKKRIEYLDLKSVTMNDKTVADLGSAGGFFVRYAKDRGAKRAVGYDHAGHGSPDPIKGAYIASIELGYHDIDFYSHDLNEKIPEVYDVVFFLSMNFHIGIPDWLNQVATELVIFEDNSKQRNARETLAQMFDSVKQVGVSKDHGDKPIYHCRP